MTLPVGSKAPDFVAPALNAENEQLRLSDYLADGNVLLAFYPLDFSPVCSVQIPEFSENVAQFQRTNTRVIAVSVDSMYAHKAWNDKLGGLKIPLVSDLNREIASKFGVLRPDGFAERAMYFIEKGGIIKWAFVEETPASKREIREVLGKVVELTKQTATA